MRFVVVFDTNVLFSGIGWRGKPFECLELARTGTVDGIVCAEILAELTEKLQDKLQLTPDRINETLADLLSYLTVVTIPNQLRVIVDDPDDDRVLECAVVGQATHIVSGDRRHLLSLGGYQNIRIVSPSDLLQLSSEGKDRALS